MAGIKPAPMPPRPDKPRSKLTDKIISSAVDFLEGQTKIFHDAAVPGLRIRIGRNKRTWIFAAEYQVKGKRGNVFKRLGFWPGMEVAEARRAALIEAGKVASGRPQPGRKDALTLDAATAEYILSLKARGKKSAAQVERLVRIHLLPEFGRFTLAELSDSPALVRDLHLKISKSAPVSANRVMSQFSAIYRHSSRLDRSLPAASPISAVRLNRENPAQTSMPFDQYPPWGIMVAALPPLHQAYHRLLLLTGMRGGEAQRLEWRDIDCRARTITLRGTKTGKDVVLPLSSAIARELKRARSVSTGGDTVFPAARKWTDRLPYRGHDLRHSFRSVAADLGTDELQVRLLMGHSLIGVSQNYITKAILSGGTGLRAAQRRISHRIIQLLA